MNPEINIQPLREVSLPYGNLRSQLLDRAILFRGNIMEEIWKPIKGYEGLYEVSNCGDVKSLGKSWKCGRHLIREKSDTIMIGHPDQRGYLRLMLRNNNNSKTVTIHQLVWDHFGDKPRNGRKLQVDHKDENKRNNRIDNLQLLTNRQNVHKSLLANKKNGLPLGVCLDKRTNKYAVKIKINGRTVNLGRYSNPQDAGEIYQKKLKEVI